MSSQHMERRRVTWMKRSAKHLGFDDVEEMIETWVSEDGLTERDIAEIFDMSRRTLSRMFYRNAAWKEAYRRGRAIWTGEVVEQKEDELLALDPKEFGTMSNSQTKMVQYQLEVAKKRAARYSDEFDERAKPASVEVNISAGDQHLAALQRLGNRKALEETAPQQLTASTDEPEEQEADYEILEEDD